MTLILSGSDGLSDVDGSAATPAIRGTDANTGIFFPAADTIGFAEGGAEVMRITSGGYLKASNNGTYNNVSGSNHEFYNSANAETLIVRNGNASFSSEALIVSADRNTTNNSYYFLRLNVPGVANRLLIADSGSISTAGSVQLGDAGAPPTSGVGVKFPATQSASSDANTLDDYEEGTWTPALAGEGGGSNTFTVKYGYYTKVGRLVTVSFATSAIASPAAQTGNWVITGLPFTSANFTTTQSVLWGGSFSHYRQFPVQASSTGLFPACVKNTATLRISVMYGGPAQTETTFVTGGTPSSILEISGTVTYETA